MIEFRSASEVLGAVDSELGTSPWHTVDQRQVDMFAAATGDSQWIHVDVARAKEESPYGGTIAHGFFTLSLIPVLSAQIYRFEGVRMAVNYGLNKLRFPAPVPVDSQVRLRTVLVTANVIDEQALQMVFGHTIDVRGSVKPALAAEMIVRASF